MQASTRDRMARAVFAATIVAAHLLLVWLLNLGRNTAVVGSPEPSELVLLLKPGDLLETLPESGSTEPKPSVFAPPLLSTPPEPVIEINEPTEPVVAQAITQAPAPAASREEEGRRPGSGQPGQPGPSDHGLAVVRRVMPAYPTASARAGEQGGTVLEVLVDERGRPKDIRVARSSGFPRLDESAIRALRQWRFTPSMRQGRPVSSWGQTEIRFQLYQLTLSRLAEEPLDPLPNQTIPVTDERPVPGGASGLRGLIEWLRESNPAAAGALWPATEAARMKRAVMSWGPPQTIRFQGSVAGGQWRLSELKPEYQRAYARRLVELRWDRYAITHERGTSDWRIGLDKEGNIWAAYAGTAMAGAASPEPEVAPEVQRSAAVPNRTSSPAPEAAVGTPKAAATPDRTQAAASTPDAASTAGPAQTAAGTPTAAAAPDRAQAISGASDGAQLASAAAPGPVQNASVVASDSTSAETRALEQACAQVGAWVSAQPACRRMIDLGYNVSRAQSNLVAAAQAEGRDKRAARDRRVAELQEELRVRYSDSSMAPQTAPTEGRSAEDEAADAPYAQATRPRIGEVSAPPLQRGRIARARIRAIRAELAELTSPAYEAKIAETERRAASYVPQGSGQ